jgi:NAD(P)-dependent dehydrogenase (short-subunit alcohol dehydrogenase family)
MTDAQPQRTNPPTPSRRRLAMRVAIVTGGSSGIGRDTCLQLAREGASVVVVGTNRERIDQVVSALDRGEQGDAHHLGLALDVRSEADMEEMAARTVDRFGRIDILVACAGILRPSGTPPKPLAKVSEGEWDEVIDINLKGAFLGNRAVLPTMLAQKQGDIVNVSSVSGLKGRAHDAPYCASKFALIGMTGSLAAEVGSRGIRVQSVVPGAVDTPIWQQNAPFPVPRGALTPDRVAALIVHMLAAPADTVLRAPVVVPSQTP